MIATINIIRANNVLMGTVCVLFATLGLSLKAIFIKMVYLQDPTIDAVSILALRFVMAMPFFLLLLTIAPEPKQAIRFNHSHIIVFALLGMVGFYVSAILDFSALAYIPAGLERLILFLYPTFVVIISFFIRPEEVTKNIIIALVVSYLGVLVVFIDQAPQLTDDTLKGIIMVLGAAIVFAAYTVASVKHIKQHGAIRFTTYAMIAATIMTLMHAFYAHGLDFFTQSLTVYSIILLMALFSTVLPLILMAEGVRRIGASKSSIISTSGPVITIALAILLLDEAFGIVQAIGAAMIIMGVFLVSKKKKPA